MLAMQPLGHGRSKQDHRRLIQHTLEAATNKEGAENEIVSLFDRRQNEGLFEIIFPQIAFLFIHNFSQALHRKHPEMSTMRKCVRKCEAMSNHQLYSTAFTCLL